MNFKTDRRPFRQAPKDLVVGRDADRTNFDETGRCKANFFYFQSIFCVENFYLKILKVFTVMRLPFNVEFPLTVAFWYTVTPADKKYLDIFESYSEIWKKFKFSHSSSSMDESSADDDTDGIIDNA